MSEAIRLSVEDTKIAPCGTTIWGDGFSVRVPEVDLYLVRGRPMRGDLCLRMRGDWPGGSYNVYPFTVSEPGLSPQEAWQIHARQQMARKFLTEYHISSQYTNIWHSSDAWFQTGYIASELVAANCVIRRGTNYYWIDRSIGLLSSDSLDLTNTESQAEHDLKTFLGSFRLDQ